MTELKQKPVDTRENWINHKWRPSIGWLYICICAFDFIIGPIFVMGMIAQGIQSEPWVPLTTSGGGLIHITFGAILGVTSWSRGQEKIAGVSGRSPKS